MKGFTSRLKRLEEVRNRSARLDLGEYISELFGLTDEAKQDPVLCRLHEELFAAVPPDDGEYHPPPWNWITDVAARHPEGRRLLARITRRMRSLRTGRPD